MAKKMQCVFFFFSIYYPIEFYFLGKSGIGKSSIIRCMIRDISVAKLQRMNFNSEQEGTTELRVEFRGFADTVHSKTYFSQIQEGLVTKKRSPVV